jgi:hypothetical protein
MTRWPLARDLILFVFGIGGAVWETVLNPPPDQSALIFFSACIGLPAFLPDGIRISRAEREDPKT